MDDADPMGTLQPVRPMGESAVLRWNAAIVVLEGLVPTRQYGLRK